MRNRIVAAAFVTLGLAAAAGGSFWILRHGGGRRTPAADARHSPAPVRGALTVAIYDDAAAAPRPGSAPPAGSFRHTHSYVNGVHYHGMEDNDLRGYLDGRWKYQWSQPGQIHVRVGRRSNGLAHGEHELFRVLLRWDDIRLPRGARVLEARLTLALEETAPRAVPLLLYAVNKDWFPGTGGEKGDNVSAPLRGDVTWTEVAHAEREWSLPGIGFASDEHADADTPAMPLADAICTEDTKQVVFHSPQLTAYASERLGSGQPLLFLLKVADPLEDVPGTCVTPCSGNHGDPRNTARRPRLTLTWEGAAKPAAGFERSIFLEHGRELHLPRLASGGGRLLAVSFRADPGYERPTILVREGSTGQLTEWRPFPYPAAIDHEWVEIRLLAAHDAVTLGEPFECVLTDTWIRTAPPEEQVVPWTFISPLGERRRVVARYLGDHRFAVRFTPDLLGRWRYSWTQRFTRKPYRSAEGYFDVVAGDAENVQAQLKRLLEQILAARIPDQEARVARFGVAFNRLERALLSFETPESYRSEEGGKRLALLDEVRAALSGEVIHPRPPRR